MKPKVTIKDIAESLNISQTAVSSVLNGKGDKLRISKDLQEQILRKTEEVQYVPRSSRRNQIYNTSIRKPLIGIFFSDDKLFGLERLSENLADLTAPEQPYHIVYQAYHHEKLQDLAFLFSKEYYDGIILAGLSDKELDWLEHETIEIPAAVFNRQSQHFMCVYVNSDSGIIPAEAFADNGHQCAALIFDAQSERASIMKRAGFNETFFKLTGHHPVSVAVTKDTCRASIQKLLTENKITAFYCEDSFTSIIVDVLNETHKSVPEDVEIISDGDHLWNEAHSVSSMRPPSKAMIQDCVAMVWNEITNPAGLAVSKYYSMEFVERDSFRKK